MREAVGLVILARPAPDPRRAAEPAVRDRQHPALVVDVGNPAHEARRILVFAADDLRRRVAVAHLGLVVPQVDPAGEPRRVGGGVHAPRREAFAHDRAAGKGNLPREARGRAVGAVRERRNVREHRAPRNLAAVQRRAADKPVCRRATRQLPFDRAVHDADAHAAHGLGKAVVLAGLVGRAYVDIGIDPLPVGLHVAVRDEAAAPDAGRQPREAQGVLVARHVAEFNREVADFRAVRETAEQRLRRVEGPFRRDETADRVPLPEELPGERVVSVDVVPPVRRDVVGEVEVVHQRVGVRDAGFVAGVDHVRPVVHRVDRDAELRSDGGHVLHRVGRGLRRRVRETVAHPTRERQVGIVGDRLDRQDRPRRIRLARRFAVHEDPPLRADDPREEPEVGVRVHRGVEVGAGGEAVRRVPDVLEIVVRHRRRRCRRELRRRQRLHALRVRVVAVADRRFLRAVAVLEVVGGVVAVGRDRRERADVGAGRGGNGPERERAPDRRAALGLADSAASHEPALIAVLVIVVAITVDRRRDGAADGVAVLDDRAGREVVDKACGPVVGGSRDHGGHRAANRCPQTDVGREAAVEIAHVRDAVGRAVFDERPLVEGVAESGVAGAGQVAGPVEAPGAAAAEDVGAAGLAVGVGGLHEAVARPRAVDGAVGEGAGLRVGVGAGVRVVRPLAGGAHEAGGAGAAAAHRAALEHAVPARGRETVGDIGRVLHRAAPERVGADGDARPRVLVVVEAAEDVVPARRDGAIDEERAGGGDGRGETAVADGVDVSRVRLERDGRRAVGEDLRAGRPADEPAAVAVLRLQRAGGGAVVEGGRAAGHARRAALADEVPGIDAPRAGVVAG